MKNEDYSFRQKSKDVLREANEELAVGECVINMGNLPDTHSWEFFIHHSSFN